MSLSGRCGCGRVKFTINDVPLFTQACHFCTICGTYLWCRYRYHQVPVIAVRGGTLDDTAAVRPQVHIFTRSKQSWFLLPDDVPAYEGACGREGVWPEASVRKYNALAPISQRS